MDFPCQKCGLCCRVTGQLTDAQLTMLGLERGESGFCRHFDTASSLCRIYEERPAVCRIPKERYLENAEECNKMLHAANLPIRITRAMLEGVTP